METVVTLLMLMVALSFTLKLSFMRLPVMVAEAGVIALFTILSTGLAADQSKVQLMSWLQSPDLMRDIAVVLTIDVSMQIALCFYMACHRPTTGARIIKNLLLYIPGLLTGPVSLCLLTVIMFSWTGVDFDTIGYCQAAAIVILIPAAATGLRQLLPDGPARLELIFYLNCIIAILGVISTVNGHPATVGVNDLNVASLLTCVALAVSGIAAGYLIHRRREGQNIKHSK